MNFTKELDELHADLEAGILTIECPDGSKVIVNKQAPHREIWVAARSGGFHFRPSEGAWRELGRDAQAIRTAVFVDEQKIPAELEWDEAAVKKHLAAAGMDEHLTAVSAALAALAGPPESGGSSNPPEPSVSQRRGAKQS